MPDSVAAIVAFFLLPVGLGAGTTWLLMWSRQSKQKQAQELAASARRQEEATLFQCVNLLPQLVQHMPGSKVHWQPLDPEHNKGSLPWVYTLVWEADDLGLDVTVRHAETNSATVLVTIGGTAFPKYQYGAEGHPLSQFPEDLDLIVQGNTALLVKKVVPSPS